MAKGRATITIADDTKERVLQWAYENHVSGGLSGAVEYIAWHVLKVKNTDFPGQVSLSQKEKKKKR